MEGLILELQSEAAKTRRNARRNYYVAYGLTVIIVVSSIIATIFAGVDKEPEITAFIAAIPAALVFINTTFKFERKSVWHWKKNKKIESLIRALKYENADAGKISKEYSKLDQEMDEEWISFGNPLKDNKTE